jgi:hypothetical protein
MMFDRAGINLSSFFIDANNLKELFQRIQSVPR